MPRENPILKKDSRGDYCVSHPSIIHEYSDDFYDAVELMNVNPKKSEKNFKKIIKICGSIHMDALLHLGLLYNNSGKPIEGNALIHKAHSIALQAIPKKFDPDKGAISWLDIDNRSFLRTFHCIGLELMKEKFYEAAIEKFEFIIKVNPNDNQGVRYLIADCYFHLNRYSDFFNLDKEYPDDYSVEFLYGKLLSLLKLNKIKEAKKQLQKAKKAFPNVTNELIKPVHIFPENEFKEPLYGVPVGSKQQAFLYWETTKQFWDTDVNIKQFFIKYK